MNQKILKQSLHFLIQFFMKILKQNLHFLIQFLMKIQFNNKTIKFKIAQNTITLTFKDIQMSYIMVAITKHMIGTITPTL